MFRKRNPLGKFYRLLPNYKEHIAMLENSLQDTRDMLHNRIKEYAALKNELLFLYEIFQRRNGCKIHVQLDDKRGLILYTTISDGILNNTIVYVPRECLQIAEIDATVDGKVIHTGADLETIRQTRDYGPVGLCVPRIVLMGNWLAAAGFEIEQFVKVFPLKKALVLCTNEDYIRSDISK